MNALDRTPYSANRVTKLEPVQNGWNYGGKKELISTYRFAAIAPRGTYQAGKVVVPIEVRCYSARNANASTVYATVWAHSPDGKTHLSGSGSAGGYGYHKESAAIDDAMRHAGVAFAKPFHGCGDGAVRVAIEVLAKKLGWRRGNLI